MSILPKHKSKPPKNPTLPSTITIFSWCDQYYGIGEGCLKMMILRDNGFKKFCVCRESCFNAKVGSIYIKICTTTPLSAICFKILSNLEF